MNRVCVCVLAAVFVACHREEPTAETAPVVSAAPVDRLAPGELVEGKDKLFGFALPRGAVIERSFPDTAAATSDATLIQLEGYVKARVFGAAVTDLGGTHFDHVTLRSDPKRVLTITLTQIGGIRRSQIVFEDFSNAPAGDSGTVEDRRREVGMTPDGRGLADPTHLK